jgi:hypothetical protein
MTVLPGWLTHIEKPQNVTGRAGAAGGGSLKTLSEVLSRTVAGVLEQSKVEIWCLLVLRERAMMMISVKRLRALLERMGDIHRGGGEGEEGREREILRDMEELIKSRIRKLRKIDEIEGRRRELLKDKKLSQSKAHAQKKGAEAKKGNEMPNFFVYNLLSDDPNVSSNVKIDQEGSFCDFYKIWAYRELRNFLNCSDLLLVPLKYL